MSTTLTLTEQIYAVTISDSSTSLTLTNDSPSYVINLTNESYTTVNLNDLADVNTVGVSNGQVLSYNSSTSSWGYATAPTATVATIAPSTTPGVAGLFWIDTLGRRVWVSVDDNGVTDWLELFLSQS